MAIGVESALNYLTLNILIETYCAGCHGKTMHAHRTLTTLTCSLLSDLLNQCMCHVDIGLVSCIFLASIDSVLSIYCQHNTH